jgi:hypothetical protein
MRWITISMLNPISRRALFHALRVVADSVRWHSKTNDLPQASLEDMMVTEALVRVVRTSVTVAAH